MNSKAGTLFIIATPIGNLDDLTFRAIEILSKVNLCAAEDTRKTKKLFTNYKIDTKLTSYHKFSERKKLNTLLSYLTAGNDLALVSDAGTPLVSDPGLLLVQEAISLNINVIPIPGPSSVIAALSVSGFSADNFQFLGFPPRKKNERLEFIRNLSFYENTSVVFESGLRIKKLLEGINDINPDKVVSVSREITKLYETHYRGKVRSVINELDDNKFGDKGEFVLVLEGHRKVIKDILTAEERRIFKILLNSFTNKEALLAASEILKIKKNVLYKELIEENK